jgi:hypothetical protein
MGRDPKDRNDSSGAAWYTAGRAGRWCGHGSRDQQRRTMDVVLEPGLVYIA